MGEEELRGSAEGVGMVNQFVMKAELNNGILLFVLESLPEKLSASPTVLRILGRTSSLYFRVLAEGTARNLISPFRDAA